MIEYEKKMEEFKKNQENLCQVCGQPIAHNERPFIDDTFFTHFDCYFDEIAKDIEKEKQTHEHTF